MALRWLLCIVALGILLVVQQGCSDPVRRYHVLSMFFDGVPVPPGVTPPPGQESNPEGTPRAGSTLAAGGAQTQPAEPIYHTAYRRRQCAGCHEQSRGNQATRNAKTCGKCHTTYVQLAADDWVHGPLVTGQCGLCHEAHQSQYPQLLTAEVHTLCNQCHGPQWIEGDAFHRALKDPRCPDCHDPHAAGNRLLLADSRTYERRAAQQRPIEGHTDSFRNACAGCHLVGQANQVRPNVDAMCQTCHPGGARPVAGATTQPVLAFTRPASLIAASSTTKPAGATTGPGHLHQAVADGKCTTCHNPHRSILPHLVKPTAERICLSCHKLDELRKGDHPNVTRVNCVLCHNGHQSPRPHLLRPGIPEPEHVATDRGPTSPPSPPGRGQVGTVGAGAGEGPFAPHRLPLDFSPTSNFEPSTSDIHHPEVPRS